MAQPQCIGLILDGNRRWAKERGLPSFEGHSRGFEVLKEAVRWIHKRGIPHVVVFAFSTENWGRSQDEVSHLMNIFRTMIDDSSRELSREGVRIRFVGQRSRFDADLQEGMSRVESESASNTTCTLWVCLSYGGRAEIIQAAQEAAKDGEISEASLAERLWTSGMPDPDLVVRTSGEHRLSGFMTWQSVYSELFFVKPHWPDFNEALLDEILQEYAERERRHGK